MSGQTNRRAGCVLALPFVLAACSGSTSLRGDADGGDADGGDADGGDADGGDIGTDWGIVPPAPPVLTPCPEGWREVPPEEPGGIATCDPWPDGDPVTLPTLTPCPEGWRELPPGEPGGIATCDPWPEGDPVSPPVFTPCPAGWREVTDAETGTVTCDPWPEGGPHDCAADEAHFPGEPDCTRIGDPCPAGDWAEDLPSAGVLYVRAGAGSGGTGTRESPFGSVAEATAAATSGTTVALSRGTFDEAVVLPAGVALWGACVSDTVVASSAADETGATITAGGADTAVRNLQVGGERRGLQVLASGASLDLHDVLVVGVVDNGVLVRGGGSLTAAGLVVRETRSRLSDGAGGRGLQVGRLAEEPGEADISRAAFERNAELGVLATCTGTRLVLADVAIREGRGQEGDGAFGDGLWAQAGAEVVATRMAVERNREFGVAAVRGADLTLADVVIRDTRGTGGPPDVEGEFGDGIQVSGAVVEGGLSHFPAARPSGAARGSRGLCGAGEGLDHAVEDFPAERGAVGAGENAALPKCAAQRRESIEE
jgi:hypothetical protein